MKAGALSEPALRSFGSSHGLNLRPIVNAAVAPITTDATLAGSLIAFRNNQDLEFLDRGRMNAYGLGGSLMLAYYDHLPKGSSKALTVNLWGRLRWPTGVEAFHRPVRWVTEAQHSHFLGDPQAALGFDYLTKVGGGLELDTGALKIGAFGLYMERVRLVGRYVFGANVSGFSVGLGVTF
jgi:hypothetical protein